MAATIQVRRGLETNLPTLSQGELGFTTDTHKTYIGDGSTNHLLGGGSAANDATITLSAGSGITGGGSFTTDQSSAGTITFSHADTSSQASVDNSNGVFIQDISVDTYGHITSLTSVDLDGRYFTEAEADARFVNITGDTMTGDLIISNSSSIGIGISSPTHELSIDGSLDVSDSVYVEEWQIVQNASDDSLDFIFTG